MTTIEERALEIKRAITDLKLNCYLEMYEELNRRKDEESEYYWLSIIGALDEAEDKMIDAFKRM